MLTCVDVHGLVFASLSVAVPSPLRRTSIRRDKLTTAFCEVVGIAASPSEVRGAASEVENAFPVVLGKMHARVLDAFDLQDILVCLLIDMQTYEGVVGEVVIVRHIYVVAWFIRHRVITCDNLFEHNAVLGWELG